MKKPKIIWSIYQILNLFLIYITGRVYPAIISKNIQQEYPATISKNNNTLFKKSSSESTLIVLYVYTNIEINEKR